MKEFFKRNRKVLVVSLIIFMVFAVASAIVSFIMIGDNYGVISGNMTQAIANGTVAEGSDFTMDTLELFLHNLSANLIIIAGGLLFSVVSILATVLNAVSIGSAFGVDLAYFAPAILPHGIIEYAATVFALAAAFKITQLEITVIKTRNLRNTLSDRNRELKDIGIMILIVVVLLAIAAVIEANFTVKIAMWIFGMN